MNKINKHKIQFPYIVSDFMPHQFIKPQLLKMLSEQPCTDSNYDSDTNKDDKRVNYSEHVYRTDWYYKKYECELREYWNFLFPMIHEHMKLVMKELNMITYDITNYWFGHYKPGNELGWHRHIGSTWANVYYIHLPNPDSGTVLRSPFDSKKLIRPKVREGTILTFPALTEHAHIPVPGDNSEKIVIAFNIV